MPRARNIKPGFFDNSELGKLPSDIRLLYIGLWTLADREGVLEYDLAAIRRYVFGYKSEITEQDLNGYLTVISRLDHGESTLLKECDGKKYIVLLKFPIHQNPHHTEKKGRLPSLEVLKNKDNIDLTVNSPLLHGENLADSLIPDSLIPDSLIPDSLIPESVIEKSREQEVLSQFDVFWEDFPTNGRNKGSKKDALAKFRIALKKSTFNEIQQGMYSYANYIKQSGQSNQDAFRWLEKERWREDYGITTRVPTKSTVHDDFTAGIELALSELAQR